MSSPPPCGHAFLRERSFLFFLDSPSDLFNSRSSRGLLFLTQQRSKDLRKWNKLRCEGRSSTAAVAWSRQAYPPTVFRSPGRILIRTAKRHFRSSPDYSVSIPVSSSTRSIKVDSILGSSRSRYGAMRI